MKLFNINKIVAIGFLMSLVACADSSTQRDTLERRTETLPYYQEATYTPVWLAQNDTVLKDFHRIPPFTLTNQVGDSITQKTFENKIYVADFFFTICPGICPQMTTNMHLVQEAFKDDDSVLLLSHSVTPDYDTVSVLKEYAEANGIDEGKWHLVTGDRKEIYDLGREGYFAEEDLGEPKGKDDFLHTENFILVDQNRHIRGIYNGLNKTSVLQLIDDIKVLKNNQKPT